MPDPATRRARSRRCRGRQTLSLLRSTSRRVVSLAAAPTPPSIWAAAVPSWLAAGCWIVVAAALLSPWSGYGVQVAGGLGLVVPGAVDRHHHYHPRSKRQCQCRREDGNPAGTGGRRRQRDGVVGTSGKKGGWRHELHHGLIGPTGFVLWARSDDHHPNEEEEEAVSSSSTSFSGGRPRPRTMNASPPIRGLLPPDDFARRQAVDATVRNLRRHLPQLLSVPVTHESEAAEAFAWDTSLVIGENDDDNRNSSNHNGTTTAATTNLVCSSLDELVDISQAVVTFVSAASQTRRLVETAVGGGATGAATGDGAASSVPRLDCRIVIDPNSTALGDEIRVDWTVRWTVPPMVRIGDAEEKADDGQMVDEVSALLLQGTSKLLLSAEGKVRQHRIRTVKLNGRRLDAAAVGGFLSNLRGTVLNFQRSPLYGFLASAVFGSGGARTKGAARGTPPERGNEPPRPPAGTAPSPAPLNPFAPLLNQVRDEVVQQVSRAFLGEPAKGAASSTVEPILASVYVIVKEVDVPHINDSNRELLQDDTGLWLLLDRDGDHRTAVERLRLPSRSEYPLPGTSDWSRYASVHERVVEFVDRTIPVLSGEAEPSSALPMEPLFSSDCQYCVNDAVKATLDGVRGNRTFAAGTLALLSGPRKVARLYEVMASWRNLLSGSNWAVHGVDVLDWRAGTPSRVRIRYASKLVVPSPPGLALPKTTTEVKVTGADVYSISAQGRVVQVLQEELRINDGSPRDGLLFTKNLCAAIDAGSSLGDDLWTAGFARFVPGGDAVTATAGQGKSVLASKASATSGSLFSDEAALTAFRIMESLARDVPSSLPSNSESSSSSAAGSNLPASQYMMDDIRLLGYLNETILKGRSAYEASWNLAVASWKAALRTNRIEAASKDKPATTAKIEWTSDRCVRLTCELRLVIKPVIGLPMSPLPDAVPFPLRLRVVSDYVLDPATGRIVAHRLVETRLNDQPAPGDVVARWIRQLATGGTEGRPRVGIAGGDGPQNFVETSLWQWLLRSGSN